MSEGAICGKCDRAFAVLGVKGQRRKVNFCPHCGHPTGQDLAVRKIPRTWALTAKLEPILTARRNVIDVDADGGVGDGETADGPAWDPFAGFGGDDLGDLFEGLGFDAPAWARSKPRRSRKKQDPAEDAGSAHVKGKKAPKSDGWCECPWNVHTAKSFDGGNSYVCDGCQKRRRRV